jgi:hypothetical protein
VAAETGTTEPGSVPAESNSPTQETLKAAMKAFRRRLKLTKLDQESKLSHKAMSSGRHSDIVAILPPREYPPAVWEALIREGKLRDSGGGFMELAGGAGAGG